MTCGVRLAILSKVTAAQPNDFQLSYSSYLTAVFFTATAHSYFYKSHSSTKHTLSPSYFCKKEAYDSNFFLDNTRHQFFVRRKIYHSLLGQYNDIFFLVAIFISDLTFFAKLRFQCRNPLKQMKGRYLHWSRTTMYSRLSNNIYITPII